MIELLKREVILSAQQIGNLALVPVIVVPALSTDKKIVPIFMCAEFLYDGFPMVSTGMFGAGRIDLKPDGAIWSYLGSGIQPINLFSGSPADSVGATSGAYTSGELSSDVNGKSLVVLSSALITASSGPIIAINPQSGTGLGYAIGDTGHISQTGNTSATYVIDSVNGGGGVLTFHLDFGGNNYSTGIGVSTTVSSGAGDGLFLADIISVGAGRLKIDLLYAEV